MRKTEQQTTEPVTVSSRDVLLSVGHSLNREKGSSLCVVHQHATIEPHHPELWVTIGLSNGARVAACLVVSEVQPIT